MPGENLIARNAGLCTPEVLADFHEQFAAFSLIGATPGGGLCRLTGSTEDGLARQRLEAEISGRGATLAVDPVGNMFGTFTLAPQSGAVVLVGSHLDSVPTGGRFDGNYGVVAGLVAASAVAERLRRTPGVARRNLAVVNWTNEEGSRFQPSLLGSSVFVGVLAADDVLATKDRDGVSLGAALRVIGYARDGKLGLTPVRYLEIHNEQGDRLERTGADIGLVHGAWAARKFLLRFIGQPSHTGSTPMPIRRDALRCAAAAIGLLHEIGASEPDVHTAAARIELTPNSPNVVASEARVWMELRHERVEVTDRLGATFLERVHAAAAELGVAVEVLTDDRRGVFHLDPAGVDLLREAADGLGLKWRDLDTIAGHDALALQKLVPSSLVFVPCRGGLSHNEGEFTEPGYLEKGLSLITEALWRMVTSD